MSGGAFLLEEMGPEQLERRRGEVPALVLPLGTIEWHSHHLPLGLDGIKAAALAAAVAEGSGVVQAPTSWWAAVGALTLTLCGPRGPGRGIAQGGPGPQFAGMGFRVLAVVNGHYGLENSIATRKAALSCMGLTGRTVLTIAEYEVLTDLGARGDHAGVWETSLLWANRPDLVRLEGLGPDKELPGVVGEDPRGRASHELGARGLEVASGAVARAVERGLAENALERSRYVTALEAGSRALEALAVMCAARPKSEVPPVVTPAWIRHLRALNLGRYAEAADAANQKLSDPTA